VGRYRKEKAKNPEPGAGASSERNRSLRPRFPHQLWLTDLTHSEWSRTPGDSSAPQAPASVEWVSPGLSRSVRFPLAGLTPLP
jgi:hypothetical protein